MANVNLEFMPTLSVCDPQSSPVLIIGQVPHLKAVPFGVIKAKLAPRVTEQVWNMAVSSLNPNPTDTVSLYLNFAALSALPTSCSRHNTQSRAHSLSKLVKASASGPGTEFIVIVCNKSDVVASACAVARSFPLFNMKTLNVATNSTPRNITIEFVLNDGGELTETDIGCLRSVAVGVRLAGNIVDAPCNIMNTDAFVEEAKKVANELGIVPQILRGEDLAKHGFGGIYGVGKAALHPPALVVLSHMPPGAKQTIAWVGKGIVYDTGGLCIKDKTNMPGMKRDCGGAAGILGAFYATVKEGFKENLHCILCLAENAVGPIATRPDDIHTMYSGKTVEINNTDAEGRLVLADGVVYAYKDLKADVILDMATLTGAQGVATGLYHAALVTNNENWEDACVEAGRVSGDLVHPLIYSPELHFQEFNSSLADMKNSVACRTNAQSSCAGLFVAAHLGFDYPGVWMHVDMAYPVHCGERATGYGVSLLATLFGYASRNALLQSISPVEITDQPAISTDPADGQLKKRIKLSPPSAK